MLKRISLIGLCFIVFFTALYAEELVLKVKTGKKEQVLNENTFNSLSKEKFEIKGNKDAFLTFNQLSEHYKLKTVKSVEIKTSEGMQLIIKQKEFNNAGLVLTQEKKHRYYRIVVKGDSFRNRWLKNVTQIEFK